MSNEKYDVNYWIEKGKELVANRQRRIERAKKWKFDTVATHGLYDAREALSLNNGSIMEPVYLTTAQAYHNSAEMEVALAYQMPTWCYTRIANPSNYFLEETAALLETYGSDMEASCVATASGMSAIRTATDPFLVKDDRFPKPNIVASAKVYGGTFQQFWVRRYQEQGIEVRWIKDPTDMEEWASRVDDQTRYLYGEFPSNPTVDIFDISAVAELAHSHGIPLIVDSTCASPALTRPLLLGADIVVQSASKVISASGTSIVGLVISKKNITSKIGDDEMKEDFATWAKLWPYRDNGPALSPFNAIMTLNDMRTLRSRVEKMSRNALTVAKYLEGHPKIESVHYPGLESYKAHAIAQKYMKLVDSDENHYGYMMAVDIKEDKPGDSKNARKFYDALDMIWRATDLGRVKTVATLNAISTHQQQGEEGRRLASIKPSTCRISCGVEAVEDIIADLEQALDAI
ncbi:MAG TPA: O-acetylhomoserine aminocarboxypropyltransferase/cysteine synthase [Caldithrix abyssi]|uniref:O-acetylhomoserine aminocarboxypropyltransferase/cysteine synthase n=1 Tax=Caldithrix abyssi TaxID=187145 RepID=A0A7V5PPE3_CALAY|nr:O-acetylhomoserine aminocarboxypropyltransferase/cysteine synthase [Caldithrix abyssi]